MSSITNDSEMRQAVDALAAPAQRVLAARFVANVLSLSDDSRLQRVLDTAARPDAGEDELADAYRAAKAAALEAHARCGADGEWIDQAGYFVARAAEAAVAPQIRSYAKGPAWHDSGIGFTHTDCPGINPDFQKGQTGFTLVFTGSKATADQYRYQDPDNYYSLHFLISSSLVLAHTI